MDTYKMIVIGALTCALAACGGSSDETVSKTKYDALVEECNNLKQLRDQTAQANEEQANELDSILTQINLLTGETSELRRDVENRRGSKQKATQISEGLQELKERLDKAAADNSKLSKQYKGVIVQLKQTIEQKEQEITQLNTVIEEQSRTISGLNDQLTEKSGQLEHTEGKLRDTQDQLQQKEMQQWVNMGDKLMEAADLLPTTKGHGNMKEIKKAKLLILQRARACYEQAAVLGATNVSTKIQSAARKYQEAS